MRENNDNILGKIGNDVIKNFLNITKNINPILSRYLTDNLMDNNKIFQFFRVTLINGII